MARAAQSIEERFWSKVDRRAVDECWFWTGNKVSGERPYGRLYIDGRRTHATHVSWSLHHGEPFPSGKIACHSCDNPNCVNPAHIWVGSAADNTRDMLSKGRAASQKPSTRAPATHCQRGHLFEGQRPYPSETRFRRCRVCHYERTYARRASQGASA